MRALHAQTFRDAINAHHQHVDAVPRQDRWRPRGRPCWAQQCVNEHMRVVCAKRNKNKAHERDGLDQRQQQLLVRVRNPSSPPHKVACEARVQRPAGANRGHMHGRTERATSTPLWLGFAVTPSLEGASTSLANMVRETSSIGWKSSRAASEPGEARGGGGRTRARGATPWVSAPQAHASAAGRRTSLTIVVHQRVYALVQQWHDDGEDHPVALG